MGVGTPSLIKKFIIVANSLFVAILYYDFLLTLGDEVECVWFVRKTISVWLFLVNRYFPLLAVSRRSLPEGLT